MASMSLHGQQMSQLCKEKKILEIALERLVPDYWKRYEMLYEIEQEMDKQNEK